MAMEKIFLSIQVIHAWRISKNKESRHRQENEKIFKQKEIGDVLNRAHPLFYS
jgi:hypothetical protein